MPFNTRVHLVSEGSIDNIYVNVLKSPLGLSMQAVSHDFLSTLVQVVAQKLSSVATALSTFRSLYLLPPQHHTAA